KSVERNAVNMYEARKFLLGLESNGVSSSSPSLALNPTSNGPSPSLICPVGLDILTSAGLGLSNLGNLSISLHTNFHTKEWRCYRNLFSDWKKFPRCDSVPFPPHLCHPEHRSEQPKLSSEPPADAEPKHSHTIPLHVAQFAHQHPKMAFISSAFYTCEISPSKPHSHASRFSPLLSDPLHSLLPGSDTFVEVGMPRSPSHSANGSELKQMLASCKTSSGKRQAVELLQGTKNSHLQYVCVYKDRFPFG
ncbi:hypothetical protein GOODEAATRI_005467, partial [Goodea atripinnis]